MSCRGRACPTLVGPAGMRGPQAVPLHRRALGRSIDPDSHLPQPAISPYAVRNRSDAKRLGIRRTSPLVEYALPIVKWAQKPLSLDDSYAAQEVRHVLAFKRCSERQDDLIERRCLVGLLQAIDKRATPHCRFAVVVHNLGLASRR